MALLSIMFVVRQVKRDAKEEVQQYLNNEGDDILYFGDRAVFSLNAAHAFSSSCSQMRLFILCIFNLILVFPFSDLL